jgi:glycosyltransferase involved in cell wall biosynthesis
MPDSGPESPRVSVIIPVYGQAQYLSRAIDSILTQTFRELELILIDDGSPDDSPAIVDDYARGDSRVIVRHQENRGISGALNAGLEIARGFYIARLDGDDIATPDRIARQVAFLDAHPEVGLMGGAITMIDESERKLGTFINPTDPSMLKTEMLVRNVVSPTHMLRRDLLRELGGWRSTFDFAEDYDLMLRVADRANLGNVIDITGYYRMHPAQATSTHGHRQAALTRLARVSARYRSEGRLDPVPAHMWIDANSFAALDLDPTDIQELQTWF